MAFDLEPTRPYWCGRSLARPYHGLLAACHASVIERRSSANGIHMARRLFAGLPVYPSDERLDASSLSAKSVVRLRSLKLEMNDDLPPWREAFEQYSAASKQIAGALANGAVDAEALQIFNDYRNREDIRRTRGSDHPEKGRTPLGTHNDQWTSCHLAKRRPSATELLMDRARALEQSHNKLCEDADATKPILAQDVTESEDDDDTSTDDGSSGTSSAAGRYGDLPMPSRTRWACPACRTVNRMGCEQCVSCACHWRCERCGNEGSVDTVNKTARKPGTRAASGKPHGSRARAGAASTPSRPRTAPEAARSRAPAKAAPSRPQPARVWKP